MTVITIFLIGLKKDTYTIAIDELKTVKDLKVLVTEKTGLSTTAQRLIFQTKELNNEQLSLQDCGLTDDSTIYIVARSVGGAQGASASVQFRKVPELSLKASAIASRARVFPPDVTQSTKPCCITLLDDDDTPRADMPCGHAISQVALVTFVLSLIDNDRLFEIKCPYQEIGAHCVVTNKCGKTWPYAFVRKVAQLTSEERRYFEGKIASNFIEKQLNCKNCPKCGSMLLVEDQKTVRVVCQACVDIAKQRFEFCWICLKPWKDMSSTKVCGNGCNGFGVDLPPPLLNDLATCKRKRIDPIDNIPETRACPRLDCMRQSRRITTVTHDTNCKHMKCSACGKKFCMACLSVEGIEGNAKKWVCGGAYEPCAVAPVQDLKYFTTLLSS